MTANDNNPIARGEHVTDMLSAYIDGTLEEAERGSVRTHLDGCDTCRAEHAELLATRAMLRAVPAMQAPRAFTLTPEMARKVRPPSLFERIFVPANSPRMAMGSVLSFLLLFFVLVGMFRGPESTFSKIGYGLNTADSAPSQAMPAPPANREMDTALQPTATTGTAAASGPEIQFDAPQSTPEPPVGGMGGEVLPPAVPTAGTSAGSEPLPATVPTAGAGAAGGDTSTTAAEAPTAVAEAPADTYLRMATPEESRQAAPYSPPVDSGAILTSIVPLFLLALGLVLAVMAWLARRGRPV